MRRILFTMIMLGVTSGSQQIQREPHYPWHRWKPVIDAKMKPNWEKQRQRFKREVPKLR